MYRASDEAVALPAPWTEHDQEQFIQGMRQPPSAGRSATDGRCRMAGEKPCGQLDVALGAMRLLECFSPLFSYGLLIDEQVAGHAVPDHLATVQARAQVLLEQARKTALAAGKPLTEVEMAGFAVVAWFDEVVLRHETQWEHPVPLQLSLFNTGGAASEFFDHLATLGARGEEVREVYSAALLLGFVGQYYYEQDDKGELGRIKALHCPSSVNASALLQSLQRDAITPQPYRVPGSPVHRLQGAWTGRRTAPFVAGAVVLLVLAAFVAPAISSAISTQAWYLVAIAVAIAGVLGWAGTVAWQELVLKRAHSRAAPHSEGGHSSRELWAAVADAARHARGAMLHPFRRRRAWRRLARHPWLLFIGDREANVRGVLQAAAHAPHARELSADETSKPWHWWIFRALVAIEPGTQLIPTAGGEEVDGASWSQALALLGRERRKLPLDGVVLCVSARALLEPLPAVEAYAATLSDLADKAATSLQLQLPLYVVVTGLESLPGYASLRATLPSAVFRRVLGLRTTGDEGIDAPLASMEQRLRSVVSSVLASQREPHGRREVFEFLQSLPALQRGLECFLRRLQLNESVAQRRLHWCGLYLIGRPQPETSGGDFVDDLFLRFLPGDWLLARRLA